MNRREVFAGLAAAAVAGPAVASARMPAGMPSPSVAYRGLQMGLGDTVQISMRLRDGHLALWRGQLCRMELGNPSIDRRTFEVKVAGPRPDGTVDVVLEQLSPAREQLLEW
jgi:hypothetical protein